MDYSVASSPNELVAIDLNNDGKLDIAVSVSAATPGVTSSQDSVAILLGKGDGTFQPALNFPSESGAYGVIAGDFNGDHIPDLIVTHFAPFPFPERAEEVASGCLGLPPVHMISP